MRLRDYMVKRKDLTIPQLKREWGACVRIGNDICNDPMNGCPEDFRDDYNRRERHILAEILKKAKPNSHDWNWAWERMEKFLP